LLLFAEQGLATMPKNYDGDEETNESLKSYNANILERVSQYFAPLPIENIPGRRNPAGIQGPERVFGSQGLHKEGET
jgi:hypothetical protein